MLFVFSKKETITIVTTTIMEKNLDEDSGYFDREDESTNVGNTPHSPLAEPPTDDIDAKPNGETENAADDADIHEGKPKEEKKEEGEEEKEEKEAVEVTPETPPPSLENVSKDIDRLLVILQQNNNDNNNNNAGAMDVSLEISDSIDRFLDLVEETLARYDTGEAKWGDAAEEDSSLLEAVNRISNLMKWLSSDSSSQPRSPEGEATNGWKDWLVNRIGIVQQRAMSYLEEEFRLLLIEDPRNRSNSEPAGSVTEFPGLADEAVASLNKIARQMISGGYQSECCQVYTIARRHALEDRLRKLLASEKFSIDEIHKMHWEPLEKEIIPTWINAFMEFAAVHFPAERGLAESVFAEQPPSLAASLYGSLCRGAVIQILNFPESVAMTKRAPEKLFRILDMFETLRDAIPELDNTFPGGHVDEVKAEMTSAKCRLGEAAILIFCDLENSIKSDTGKTPVAGGAVHPLTRYVMNYLSLASEYKDTLEEVFREHSKIEHADSTKNNDCLGGNGEKENASASPFAAQLMRVMELLDSNLEGKAKLYKEVALSCIFRMNNGRYIVQKIKGSTGIYEVMGETWCRKRSTELRTYHKNYQIETWSKILGCLSPKGLNENGKVQKPVLKERLKSFNALFEEVHKTQSSWVVSDEQLQSELRVSISALVIPAYRSFLGRFSQYLYPGRQTEKYVKYQVEDLETCIDELFDGNPHHQAFARKHFS